jgi:hypothetical protein
MQLTRLQRSLMYIYRCRSFTTAAVSVQSVVYENPDSGRRQEPLEYGSDIFLTKCTSLQLNLYSFET